MLCSLNFIIALNVIRKTQTKLVGIKSDVELPHAYQANVTEEEGGCLPQKKTGAINEIIFGTNQCVGHSIVDNNHKFVRRM